MSARRVEVLFFAGCPHVDLALRRTREAIRVTGIDAEIIPLEVDGEHDAAVRGFVGSPSIRVDGHDVDPVTTDEREQGLRCRLYPSNGTMEGAPPVECIAAALRGDVMTRTKGKRSGRDCCSEGELKPRNG